jgi:hypothetical protein
LADPRTKEVPRSLDTPLTRPPNAPDSSSDPEQRGFKAALNALEAEKRVFDDPEDLTEFYEP